METPTVGKVLVTAKIENLGDLYNCKQGRLPPDQVRSVEVPDALVDTGAMLLSLPSRLIQQLGLTPHRTRRVRTAGGVVQATVYEAVRLTVEGRDATVEVLEVANDCPVLIGQVPLEILDFVVNPTSGKLMGNPDHGGEQMVDLF